MVYQQKLPSAAAYYDRRKMITKMPRFFYLLLGVNFFIVGKCLSHLVFSSVPLYFAVCSSQPPLYSLFTRRNIAGTNGRGGKRGEREKEDWLLVFWAEEKKGEARLIVDPGNPGERWLRQSAQANGEVEGKEVKVPD